MNPEVRVYCNEPSHEPKVAKVETYQRIESGKWRATDNLASTAANWQRKQEGKPPTKSVGAEVKTLEAIDGEQWKTVRWSRHRLVCPLCNLTVPARTEVLWPVLDTLADNGHDEVTLRVLGAILR